MASGLTDWGKDKTHPLMVCLILLTALITGVGNIYATDGSQVWHPTWKWYDTSSRVKVVDYSQNCTSSSPGYPKLLRDEENGFWYDMINGKYTADNPGNLNVDYYFKDGFTLDAGDIHSHSTSKPIGVMAILSIAP